ncbi:glucose-6-phosphatase 2 isoform X2 [Myotis daubentonii]|uniref:glucose-6-phosphatase 2 isoform X2 n=1 Tax=Myotis daubentonii TaxID=98922 RepID=UPI002872CD72|nr:glucose-6-phosphatase 2 isoform X2 [Myotis daubentonii]
MDFLHRNGVLIIQHLQKDYRAYYNFLNFMSNVGDPRNIFSIYFPLWFQLNQTVGTKMIWVAVIGDWFNLIFKWILFGHRPYWWIQETQIYPNRSSPCLEQFPTTCETGPGSPSGHAMGSSCVWYVMVTAALSNTVSWMDKSSTTLHRLTWSFFWSIFWLIQISVCISRVFIATHFPHQVILGVIGAKKWCANPEWIHIDTTPFAGLVRNLGVLFGLGFAINSEMFLRSCRGENGYKLSFRLLCVVASLTTLQLYHFIKIPTHTEHLFYVLSFCKSASIPLTVVALIPYCVHVLMKPSEKKID